MLKTLVDEVIRKNPHTRKKVMYLCLSVWERQGLKLYPNQVEALLNKCSNPRSIVRAAERLGKVVDAEKALLYKDKNKLPVANKV